MDERHAIQGLMKTAMESIKEMVDVNTVVGSAVETKDGTVIVPVSRVSAGFAAGGSDFATRENRIPETPVQLPFGGGSGAGVSVQPVGFLVVTDHEVRFLSVNQPAVFDRLIDSAPEVVDSINRMVRGESPQPRRDLNGNREPAGEPVGDRREEFEEYRERREPQEPPRSR